VTFHQAVEQCWADDVPICPVEVRNGEVWVKTTFGHADPAVHWRQRLADGLAHDLGLVIATAVHGQLAADVPRVDVVRQVTVFGAQNRDGWGVGLTILTALANLLPTLPEEESGLDVAASPALASSINRIASSAQTAHRSSGARRRVELTASGPSNPMVGSLPSDPAQSLYGVAARWRGASRVLSHCN
jgi:hypothetical protein